MLLHQDPLQLQSLVQNHPHYLSLALIASEIISLPIMAIGLKSLTEMMIFQFGHKTIFIMIISVVPFWLGSFLLYGWT
jgi:hypothetical protein